MGEFSYLHADWVNEHAGHDKRENILDFSTS